MQAQLCSGSGAIVGGGANSAGQAAVFLAEQARKVFLLIRGGDLNKGMSRYLSRRIEQTSNIDVLLNSEITRLEGERCLEAVEITNNRTGAKREIRTPAVFTFIGARPHSDWLPDEVETDDSGFIKTGSAVADVSHWKPSRAPYFWKPVCLASSPPETFGTAP